MKESGLSETTRRFDI